MSALAGAVVGANAITAANLTYACAGRRLLGANADLVLAVNRGNIAAIEALTAAGASRLFRIHWAALNGHAKVMHTASLACG